MKKIVLSIFLLQAVAAEAQDTLKNFNPSLQAPVVLQYTGTTTGYYTGHNSYFDEEWAEKYYISGANQVVGVIAWHSGAAGTYTENCEYKVYGVSSSGLPGVSLATKTVAGSSINVAGVASYTAFNSNVNVSDSFFVSFNLDDYAHNNPGTKKIALMHGPAGSRAASDTVKYGRNVVRWHNHDHTTLDWKDFYFDNSTPVLTHFAIFPVVAFATTSVSNYATNGTVKMGGIYPNPATGVMHFEWHSSNTGTINCTIMDVTGKSLKRWSTDVASGSQVIDIDTDSFSPGSYILMVDSKEGSLAQFWVKQ